MHDCHCLLDILMSTPYWPHEQKGRTTPGGNPHHVCQDLTREHEYRDKLIKLTDMIEALPMRGNDRNYKVGLDENTWNQFLADVAELGVDDD